MRACDIVTLWHWGDSGESAERKVFRGVHIYQSESIEKSGIKEKGFHKAGKVIVRIPGNKDAQIACGDYLGIGECIGDLPDYSKAVKIVSVTDNRRGRSPHIKLVCGG